MYSIVEKISFIRTEVLDILGLNDRHKARLLFAVALNAIVRGFCYLTSKSTRHDGSSLKKQIKVEYGPFE